MWSEWSSFSLEEVQLGGVCARAEPSYKTWQRVGFVPKNFRASVGDESAALAPRGKRARLRYQPTGSLWPVLQRYRGCFGVKSGVEGEVDRWVFAPRKMEGCDLGPSGSRGH